MKKSIKAVKSYLWQVLFLCVTLLIFTPLVIFITNREEFWFYPIDFVPMLVLLCFVLAAVILAVLALLPEKWAGIVCMVVFGMGLALYVQGQLLPNNYGTLDGDEIVWENYTKVGFLSTGVWLAIIALAVFLHSRMGEKFLKATKAIAIAMLCYEALMLAMLIFTADGDLSAEEDGEMYLTVEEMYEVSDDNNLIVIILDSFDAAVFEDLLAEDDSFTRDFEGFAYYRDTVGGGFRTGYATPFILYGKEFMEPVSYVEYKADACANSPFMAAIKSKNVDATLYTRTNYLDKTRPELIRNLATESRMKPSSYLGLAKDVVKLAAFREFPHYLKKYVWMYSGDFDDWKGGDAAQPYAMNSDFKVYQELCEQRLSICDEENVFRFLHLKGPHTPYNMNEYAQKVSADETSELQQARGSLVIVNEYLSQLKSLGVYDQSTVVVMSDHGFNRGVGQNPMFMIKPAGQRGSFVSSDFPLSHANLQDIFCQALDGCTEYPEAYVEKLDERYFYVGFGATDVTEYVVKGKAYDENAVTATGRVNKRSDDDDVRYRTYELGEELSFVEDATGNPYCVYGFGHPEMLRTWMKDNYSVLRFKLDGKYKNLLMSIEYNQVYNAEQNFTIFVNGHEVSEMLVKGKGPLEILVPGKYIENDEMELVFYHPDAISPLERGKGNDGRRLSLALTFMQIESVKDKVDTSGLTKKLADTPEFADIADVVDYKGE